MPLPQMWLGRQPKGWVQTTFHIQIPPAPAFPPLAASLPHFVPVADDALDQFFGVGTRSWGA